MTSLPLSRFSRQSFTGQMREVGPVGSKPASRATFLKHKIESGICHRLSRAEEYTLADYDNDEDVDEFWDDSVFDPISPSISLEESYLPKGKEIGHNKHRVDFLIRLDLRGKREWGSLFCKYYCRNKKNRQVDHHREATVFSRAEKARTTAIALKSALRKLKIKLDVVVVVRPRKCDDPYECGWVNV